MVSGHLFHAKQGDHLRIIEAKVNHLKNGLQNKNAEFNTSNTVV
jgi:hypothetical protein